MFRRDIFSSGTEVKRILVGADRPEEVKKMLGPCDLVFATAYAAERVREWIRPGARLVRVDLIIDPANIRLIREKLMEVKLRQGGAR